VVMGDDSCVKGHEFESRHRLLDGHWTFIHIDLHCLFEKTENKRNRGRDWPIF